MFFSLPDDDDIEDIEGDESEDEGIDDYRVGGYHPIHIGFDFFTNNISVLKYFFSYQRGASRPICSHPKAGLGTFFYRVALQRF